nr:hypothetical protein [Schaalia odontolytica]
MVHSPMYKRLMRFVEDAKANESLSDYDSKHSSTLEAIREAEERIQHFREYQGFQGQTGDAINKWLEDAERRVRLWRASYLATSQVEVEMRRVMQHAREEAEMLSPVLVDARLDKLRDVAEVTIPVMEQYGLVGMAYNAVASTGAAVYDAIAAQANNQREASSTDILQRLNDSMQGLANNAARIKEMQEELKDYSGIYWDPNDLPHPSDTSVAQQLEDGYKGVSPHDPGVYPGNRDTDYGRSDLRGPNSGLYPNGFDDPTAQETDAEKLRRLQSQRIPDKFIKDGELGSRSNPITDPEDLKDIDLLHSRIGGERYANGLTRGGYTPAPPNDRHHPLWNINGGPSTRFDASGRTSLAGAGALGAGVLGAGALGAAALGARGASGLGAASLSGLGRGGAGGLGAGGLGGLRGGSASVGGLGSGGLPGSASASGRTTGLTGTNGAGAAGAAGKTGAGSASGGSGAAGRPGMGGFMGAGAGAGAGGGKDDKKGRRRKYEAFKFEDDEDDALPPGYVNPMSQTYGSDKDLKPASQKDDGWDPRQW